jgi:quercetin dioxygenase-like cupin family protein
VAFFDPAERERRELFPGVVARTFWGDKILMAVVDLAPGAVVPPHHHPHEQTGTVLEGELTFTIGGETKTCRRGDLYVIPGDVEHTATAGEAGAQVLDVFHPLREEWMY